MLKDPTTNSFSLLSDDGTSLKRETKKSQTEPKKPAPRPRTNEAEVKPSAKATSAPKKVNGQFQKKNDSRAFDETIAPAVKKEKKEGRSRYNKNNTNKRGRAKDRESGTGRPPNENKKGGAGKNSWGKPTDDIHYANDPIEEVEENETQEPKEEVAKEPEPAYLTLDEYTAQKAEQQKLLQEKYGTPSLRKVDASWTEGLIVVKKVDEKQTPAPKEQTKKQQGNKKVVNAGEIFKIVVNDGNTRGRGRGRGGRSGQRGPRNNDQRGGNRRRGNDRRSGNPTVNFTDKNSFPSLSGN